MSYVLPLPDIQGAAARYRGQVQPRYQSPSRVAGSGDKKSQTGLIVHSEKNHLRESLVFRHKSTNLLNGDLLVVLR